jgi:hypothetical protein
VVTVNEFGDPLALARAITDQRDEGFRLVAVATEAINAANERIKQLAAALAIETESHAATKSALLEARSEIAVLRSQGNSP